MFTEQRSETGRDILLLAAGDRAPRALLTSRADETSPKISPDGRSLAYVSNEGGRSEVYVTPLSNSARARRVSVAGGSEPAWASGGRELFYRQGTTMMAVAIDAAAVTRGDIDRLKGHGFDDAEVFDIAAAAAGRAFFTKVIESLGVEAESRFFAMDAEVRDALAVGRPVDWGATERQTATA